MVVNDMFTSGCLISILERDAEILLLVLKIKLYTNTVWIIILY